MKTGFLESLIKFNKYLLSTYYVQITLLGSTMDLKTRSDSNLRRYVHPNVQSSTIYNSQDMEAT